MKLLLLSFPGFLLNLTLVQYLTSTYIQLSSNLELHLKEHFTLPSYTSTLTYQHYDQLAVTYLESLGWSAGVSKIWGPVFVNIWFEECKTILFP